MSGDDQEVAEIAAALRAHAAWEAEICGGGWPEVDAPAAARALGQGAIVVPTGERRVALAGLAEQAAVCMRCGLHEGRTRGVFARGNPDAELVFVGEAPGVDEDRRGEPFVGKAGQQLDKMIGAMGFARDAVYVCEVVKCRPPKDRAYTAAEAGACAPFLAAQLEAIRPKVIVALGRGAGQALGCVDAQKASWRGAWGEWRGIPVMPTHHPGEVLRSSELRRPVWEDLQAVMAKLGISR